MTTKNCAICRTRVCLGEGIFYAGKLVHKKKCLEKAKILRYQLISKSRKWKKRVGLK